MSNQLCCMLPPVAVKVFQYILGWQNADTIKYYPKQYSAMLHLTVQDVELGIQTLVDNGLLTIGKIEQTFILNINREKVNQYYNVPMQKVHDHPGFKMAEEITWDEVNSSKDKKKDTTDIENMSEQQLQSLILKLQSSLDEKKRVKDLVKSMSAPTETNLPF